MKKTYRWDNLTSPEIAKLAENNAIVLIPTGSTEQHGPHLPVGTDAILATWMAERTARTLTEQGIPAVVAPTFAIANSMHHMNFAGSLSLSPRTYIQVLEEQCRAIAGVRERLEQLRGREETRCRENSRLCRALSLSGGAFLVILLL